jgi:hypothetical protein
MVFALLGGQVVASSRAVAAPAPAPAAAPTAAAPAAPAPAPAPAQSAPGPASPPPAPAPEAPSPAAASAPAARVVVIPIVVGAEVEPAADLLAGLANGLRENTAWKVTHGGDAIKELLDAPPAFTEEDRARVAGALVAIAAQIKEGAIAQATPALEAIRGELAKAAAARPLGRDDFDLAYRANALVVAALLAAGQAPQAKLVAAETALAFPGRKPAGDDHLSPEAIALLAAPPAAGGAKLVLQSRPEGCDILINGVSVGRGPAEVVALQRVGYQAQAVCDSAAGKASFPRRIVITDKESARHEVLDAAFEAAFKAEGGARLRFATADERRQLEETYARRVAERLGVDLVVFASVGELSGADWLNGRLYMRSGFLSRQALVRLEVSRATALGRYLHSGREIPGVLRPAEAEGLVAASQAGNAPVLPAPPWYSDIAGWAFVGVGIGAAILGSVANGAADRKVAESDEIRMNSQEQDRLRRDAQRLRFFGGMGTIGGALMAVTGAVLLAIPEQPPGGDFIAITPLRGGGSMTWSGRF